MFSILRNREQLERENPMATDRKRKSNDKQLEPIHAVAYLRTSSAANVGADKDSDNRQREAIERYAASSGHVIVDEFYDAAVSGADPIETRPGFQKLLERIDGDPVRDDRARDTYDPNYDRRLGGDISSEPVDLHHS